MRAATIRSISTGALFFLFFILSAPATVSAFSVPERLEYELSWLGVKAGDSVLEIKEDGDKRQHIISTTNSVSWVSVFYTVDDTVESVFIPGTEWVPVKYRLDQHEGSRRKDIEIRFEHSENKALYIDHIEKKELEYTVPSVVYDPLSALYKVRKIELTVGKSSFVTIFDSKKVYDLEVQVLKKEKIKVPAGEFDTILVVPILKSDGIFSREGPIYTWLSDDEKRLPIKLKTRVAVGSISAELTGGSYWPGKEDSAENHGADQ